MLANAMRSVKDNALALAAKAWLRERFSQYGEITDCAFDTQVNSFTIEVMLRGETQPITATVLRYEIEKTPKGNFVRLKRFDSSREWLTMLLTQLFAGKRYPLPGMLSKLL